MKPASPSDQAWIEMIESEKANIRDTDIYPLLKKWINDISPSRILDIGCGQGICSDKIDLSKRHYTGIDHSAFLIDRAKQLYGADNRAFISGSAYDLPIKDHSIDAAFSVAVWHLLKDLESAARELSRVLQPCGHFLIITANPGASSLWEKLSTEADPICFHSLDGILGSLSKAGLEVLTTETFRKDLDAGLDWFVLVRGRK